MLAAGPSEARAIGAGAGIHQWLMRRRESCRQKRGRLSIPWAAKSGNQVSGVRVTPIATIADSESRKTPAADSSDGLRASVLQANYPPSLSFWVGGTAWGQSPPAEAGTPTKTDPNSYC
jgi:hypothetical protein